MLLPDVLKVITALFRSASQASAVPAMLKYVCMDQGGRGNRYNIIGALD